VKFWTTRSFIFAKQREYENLSSANIPVMLKRNRPFQPSNGAAANPYAALAGRSRNRARETWIGRGDGLTHRPRGRPFPGNVYRRFADKDALMRAVFSRAEQSTKWSLREKWTWDRCVKSAFAPLLSNGIAGMLSAYRASRWSDACHGPVRSATRTDTFCSHQRDLEVQNFRKLVGTFLIWRDEIRHPESGVRC